MAIHDAGMFTVKEINRLKILQDVIDRNLRPGQAAEMLGITPRHCSRLLKRYRQSGPLGMNNQSRGRTGNRLLPASLTQLALNIIRERYADFGPTLAREKLEEVHGLILGKETIRHLMIKAGLWIPRRILYSDKASVFRVNNKHATTGPGETQFARAMRCLNITPLCAETSQAKGRVERAHLTLQDRLVKELRLKGISTIDAANAFAEEYMTDYNRRFAKAPRHDFNAHRSLALTDDLDAEFTWREPRRVSKNLTVQYDKVLYLIEDSEYSRRAIGKYIDVWHYPDGHKELRLNDVLLPYSTYDRLSEVDPVAIVDNKRLGHVLDVARQVQRKRDNNRSQSVPAGDEPSRRRHAPSINKAQRSLNEDDMLEAMLKLQGSSEAIFGKR